MTIASGAPVLLADPPVASLEHYLARGGGRGLARAGELGARGVIEEISRSGLRGRGGGGFPTGRKWATVRGGGPGDGAGDRYVVCNGAEGEPGTFKDRAIVRADPYQVVEGVAIAAFALEAREVFIALKSSFGPELERLRQALVEMANAGLAGEAPITLLSGPDEYLFGEETGLLQVIEGDAPLPRLFPPYLHGLWATTPNTGWSARAGLSRTATGPPTSFDASNPTLVNNLETLATATHVLARGAQWHRSLGTEGSPGFTVCTVVGDVALPGVAEVELGTPLAAVIERVGGGVADGRGIKMVLAGLSNPVILPENLGAPVSYEGLEAAGSGMGSAGFIVYDDTTSAVEVAYAVSRFLYVESCGQCPPCKLGTGEVATQLERLLAGAADADAVEAISWRLRTVTDGNRCFLPVQAQRLVASLLRAFPEEFAQAAAGAPPVARGLVAPKLVDLADGLARIDPRQAAKNPDWTYG